jgi:Protein of unknown function (DUF2934)
MQHSVAKEQSTKKAPTPEEIRKRAFEIHIERGGIHGCDLDDWMEAERELQKKYNGISDVEPKTLASRPPKRRI